MRMRIKSIVLIGALWVTFVALTYTQLLDITIFHAVIVTLFTIAIFACLRSLNQLIARFIKDDQYYKDRLNEQVSNKSTNTDQSNSNNDQPASPPTAGRMQFNESLNKAIAHAKRHNKIFAVLAISIDKFSTIKAQIGLAGCDQALNEIARRFQTTLRTEDILTKLEGEEFIVLLDDIGKPKFASTVAEKLLSACSRPLNVDGHVLKLTASIGICVFPTDGTSLESLFRNMNTALDAVKRSNGDNFQFYEKATDVEAREYIILGEALQKAILNNELTLHYQPRHHLKRGCISGVEALIRWNHPKYGNIDPSIFIPLAEETNLIIPIGEWALREACRTNKTWQDEGYLHFTVGVNLSAKQFNHPDIAKVITKVLDETGLPPDYLEIEISESVVMTNIDNTERILTEIKETGVHISIDHFGVGYTAISHLKRLPINVLKIDQSFIKGVPHIPNDISVTNSFIAIAHNFSMDVVAEGVESAEQVQYLLTQNCDMVQGYYFSYPLPAEKIVQQFKKIQEEVLI